MTTYLVSKQFTGDRQTVTAENGIAAARILLNDPRIRRVTPRANGSSLCDAYRGCSGEGNPETHAGTICFHDEYPAN